MPRVTLLRSDLTKKFQRDFRSKISKCQLITQKDERWKYINLKPTAPTIRGLIKIYKEVSPIRPIVNWKSAPAYKLAKMLSKNSIYTSPPPVPYTFNVKNAAHLKNDLLEIPYDQNLKFASFDITNMYSNLPINELIKTVDIMSDKQGIGDELKHEKMKISQIIIKQNYFQFQNTLYIQEERLVIGGPTSSIFPEIYIQYIENKTISDILLKYHIVRYFRYVDDILIVYNKDTTNIYDVFSVFNNIIPTVKFTIEEEKENKINFLEITIIHSFIHSFSILSDDRSKTSS
jgi:hypothetical protein